MAKVYVNQREYETKKEAVERAIKRFNKEVEKEKIIKTTLDRRFFVSKTEKRKQMKKIGRRKQLKQMYQEQRREELY